MTGWSGAHFRMQECMSQADHEVGIFKHFPDFDWEADFLAMCQHFLRNQNKAFKIPTKRSTSF